MKKFLKIALSALVMITLCISASAQNQKKEKKQSTIEEVTFVTDIDCKNCVKKVEAKLPSEKGLKDMKVNLSDKTVWCKYDASKTNKENLKKAIEKLGYSAEELVAEQK